jgi:hypothetical protein
MKKPVLLVLLLCLIHPVSFGQNSYYLKDSIRTEGIKLVDGGQLVNARFCQVNENNNLVQYTPYEINEFGFSKGKTYKSFPIGKKPTRYFLEQLAKGKVNLYCLKIGKGESNYYLTQCDTCSLVAIPADEGKAAKVLKKFAGDCSYVTNSLLNVKTNRDNLTRYFRSYNLCSKRPIPWIHYGFIAGIAGSKLSGVKKNDKERLYIDVVDKDAYPVPEFNFRWGPVVGFFVDVPFKSGNFSLHPEAYFKHNNVSHASSTGSISYQMEYSFSSITFPILIRYSHLGRITSSFVQAGAVYSRMVHNEGTLYKYELLNNSLSTTETDSPKLQNNMAGLSFGGGIIINYGSKYAYSAEIRYSVLNNITSQHKELNMQELSFLLGFLF